MAELDKVTASMVKNLTDVNAHLEKLKQAYVVAMRTGDIVSGRKANSIQNDQLNLSRVIDRLTKGNY